MGVSEFKEKKMNRAKRNSVLILMCLVLVFLYLGSMTPVAAQGVSAKTQAELKKEEEKKAKAAAKAKREREKKAREKQKKEQKLKARLEEKTKEAEALKARREAAEKARRESVERLVDRARSVGANAVVRTDFETSDILKGTATLFSAYGTAVIIKPAKK